MHTEGRINRVEGSRFGAQHFGALSFLLPSLALAEATGVFREFGGVGFLGPSILSGCVWPFILSNT